MGGKNPPVAELMAALRQARGGRCEACGALPEELEEIGSALEFAHLRPTSLNGHGRGGRKRYFDIRNHRHCYRLLCVECHRALDGRDGSAPALEEEEEEVPF